jgi:hypothetical protein
MGGKTTYTQGIKMIKLQDLLEQKFKECPPATQDVYTRCRPQYKE